VTKEAMKKPTKPPKPQTCAQRLDRVRQSMKTARTRLYAALGHKGFPDDKPEIRQGALRIFKVLESLTPQMARLAYLTKQHERELQAVARQVRESAPRFTSED
jgi:hypothetical protein